MTTALDTLKQYTTVVSDSGDIEGTSPSSLSPPCPFLTFYPQSSANTSLRVGRPASGWRSLAVAK
jgi:hypothetical protein